MKTPAGSSPRALPKGVSRHHSSRLLQRRIHVGLRAVLELDRPALDLPVPELVDDLEHFGPGWEHPLVHLLVRLDRQHELELLGRHLTLLRSPPIVGPPPPRPAPPFQPRRSAALGPRAPLGAGV